MPHYTLNYNVYTGVNEVENLGKLVSPYGKKACVLMDRFFIGGKWQEKIERLLNDSGIPCIFFSNFNPDPDCTEVDKCVELIKREGCDFVIAFGGGSCIDAAKAASVVSKNGGLCWEYCGQVLPNGSHGCPKTAENGRLPIIAIPTTAGTGSEVTGGAVISNHAIQIKSSVPAGVPDLSILDPMLTIDLPPLQTAYTGMDVFTHAFESYMLNTSTNISEATALQAMRLVGKSLVKAVKNGKDVKARTDMANASNLAGYNVYLTNTIIGHIVGLPLSAYFNMSHGATLAVTLDSIIDWIYPCAIDRLADVAVALRPEIGHLSQDEQAKMLSTIIREMKKEMGIDKRLSDYGATEADIPRIIQYLDDNIGLDAPIWSTHLKVPKKEDFEEILRNSL